jgi:NADPH-dependent 2,4-dienoyl-CoA reductase/sulfur reductase-like enzyme
MKSNNIGVTFAAVQWVVPGVGNYRTAKPLPLRTGAVIGAGTMGTGIAMAMLNAGIPVTLLEQNEEVCLGGAT